MSTPGWAALLPAAMVGTERDSGPLPNLPGPIGALAAEAARATDDPATALLRIAAVLATCSLAGARGSAQTDPLPAAAVDDTLPALEAGPVHDALRWSLHEGPPRLHHTALRSLAAAQRRMPPALLPQALELGRRSVALRAPLLSVLGARGLWLAAQRDDWKYAAGAAAASSDTLHWTYGTLEQRRAFLVRERETNPAAARERLQLALPELSAKERAELVTTLAISLCDADEPLLDSLRADRSREVRQAALAVLLRLPQAGHPQRAAGRVAALMRHERVLLRRRWQIEAPERAADDWKADQVDAGRPQHEPLGERAWWLYQLVRQVPLGWWTAHTALSPAELLDWATSTDWTAALICGWRDVLFAAPDEDWCDALLDNWPKALQENPSAVLALLGPDRRERHLQRRLREATESLHVTLAQILGACPAGETLSRDTSLLLAERVHDRASHLNEDYGLRGQLPEFACALHPDALERLAALPRRTDETPSCAEELHTTERVIATRRALLTLIPTRTP
jgi:hypothetical protein